jgi:hypothetical protein
MQSKHSTTQLLGQPCIIPVSIQASLEGKQRWNGWIRFLHPQGLQVRTERRFEPCTLLLFRTPSSAFQESSQLVARVADVRQLPDGLWELRCVFSIRIDQDSLREVLTSSMADEPVVRPPSDKMPRIRPVRVRHRKSCAPAAVATPAVALAEPRDDRVPPPPVRLIRSSK